MDSISIQSAAFGAIGAAVGWFARDLIKLAAADAYPAMREFALTRWRLSAIAAILGIPIGLAIIQIAPLWRSDDPASGSLLAIYSLILTMYAAVIIAGFNTFKFLLNLHRRQIEINTRLVNALAATPHGASPSADPEPTAQ